MAPPASRLRRIIEYRRHRTSFMDASSSATAELSRTAPAKRSLSCAGTAEPHPREPSSGSALPPENSECLARLIERSPARHSSPGRLEGYRMPILQLLIFHTINQIEAIIRIC